MKQEIRVIFHSLDIKCLLKDYELKVSERKIAKKKKQKYAQKSANDSSIGKYGNGKNKGRPRML